MKTRSKWILFVIALVAYLFHYVTRQAWPRGVLNDSLPSLFFIPVALPAVDFLYGLFGGPRRWSERRIVVIGTSLLAVVLFEGIAPLFIRRAVSDFWDCVALLAGGVIYGMILPHRLNRNDRNANPAFERDSPL